MRKSIKKYTKNYLLVLPFLILYCIFFLYPIISGIHISFFNWDAVHPPKLIGFKNYIDVVRSPGFLKSFTNLFKYIVMTVPVNLFVSFSLAILVNSYKGFWSGFFRSAYFVPTMVPIFLASSIWRWLYAPDVGLINTVIGWIGIPKVNWLTNPSVMIFSLIIVDVWLSAGFNMLILLAGMKNIPQDYYDAAKVDGANKFQEIFFITIPQLEPVFFLVITYGIISALQVFDAPWILTASTYTTYGGRLQGLLFPVMDMMGRAFSGLKFGQASAYGIILTVFIMLMTLFQFAIRKRMEN